MTKYKKIAFLSFILVLLMSPLLSKGIVIGTDDTNDVTKVTWNTGGLTAASVETVSKPEIDIKSIDYGTISGGNVSISIEVTGTPVFDNQTFYYISIEDSSNDNFSLLLWAGGFTGYSEENPGSLIFSDETGSFPVIQVILPEISGSKIIFTLPKTVEVLNYTSFEYDTMDFPLPAEAVDTWEWSAWSWSGQNFGLQSGEWFSDYYPNDENPYDSNGSNSSAPGFEGLSVIFGSTILAIIYKKRK